MNRKMLDTFTQVPGKNCISTSLASYLKYRGWYDLSESEMWLLAGGGLGFFYFHEDTEKNKTDPQWSAPLGRLIPRIRTDFFDLQLAAREYLNIHIHKQPEEGDKSCAHRMRALIDAGLPQIVEVDIYYLSMFPHYYKKIHVWHLITVIGYEGEHVYVREPNWEGRITATELLAARNSPEYHHHQHGKINYKWWDIKQELPLRTVDKHLIKTALNCAVYRALTVSSTKESQAILGEQAGQKILDDIRLWQNDIPETVLSRIMEHMFHQLIRPEGLSYSYELAADILSKLAQAENFTRWQQLSQMFYELSTRWKQLALMFLKGSKRNSTQSLLNIELLLVTLLRQGSDVLLELQDSLVRDGLKLPSS